MSRCLLALGSNLGDRQAILSQACAEVAALPGCQLLSRSRWHGTLPIGGAAGQGEFLNGAILLETSLPAQQLATALQEIELRLGRQRVVRWDARTIDIDMLLYADKVIDTDELTVPHPRMAFRNFVLEPAAEIAGELLHPTSGWTLASLLDHLKRSPRYVVVTARQKNLAQWLLSELCQAMNCQELSDTGRINAGAGVSQPVGGLEFPVSECGKLPVVAIRSPAELVELLAVKSLSFGAELLGAGQKNRVRPALVISLDVPEPTNLRAVAVSAGFADEHGFAGWPDMPQQDIESPAPSQQGQGPTAKITTDDPAVVLQESQAALRCIWPDLP